MTRSAVTFAAAAAILCSVSESGAQNQVGGGATFGGARGFGGGGGFGGGQGGTSFGASSLGAGGFGSAGFGGGQTAFGNANSNQNGGGYVGRGRDTAFVGRGVGQANTNARFNRPRQASSGGEGGASSGVGRRPPVRVRLRPSPEMLVAVRPSADVSSTLPRRSRMAGVTAQTRAGVTVLEGVVDTLSQRLVAEKLVALEPGVGRIENRLRVRSEAVEQIPPPQ